MRWCWMTWFGKGVCSRLLAQHKKMTFDQANVCVQWEYREWKYQKMSEVGGLAYRFSGVQSSSQEQSSWCNYNREKRICTVSMNQWAVNGEKQGEENVVRLELSEEGKQHFSEPSVVSLGNTEDSQKEESCNNQDVKGQRQRETRVFVASLHRRWWMELM